MSTLKITEPLVDREVGKLWYSRMSKFLPWTCFPWMIVSYVSIMAFSAPGYKIGPLVLSLLSVLWTFPLTAILGSIIAGWFSRYGNIRYSIYSLMLPFMMGVCIVTILIVPLLIGLVCVCFGLDL